MEQLESEECFGLKRAEKIGLWRKKIRVFETLKIKCVGIGKLYNFPEMERQERLRQIGKVLKTRLQS